ncbi:MAG: YicC/YloC family endoribonuclease [Candidatus Omnitrophota bacterium]
MGMIHSMTGFGKAAARSKYGIVTVEIRTLNHKFFELSAKIPNGLAQHEDRLKKNIHKKITRGKVYLNIELNSHKDAATGAVINRKAAMRYKTELLKLKRHLGMQGEVRLEQIIGLPGVITPEAPRAASDRYMPALIEALNNALGRIVADRRKEGKALSKDLSKRVGSIKVAVEHIDKRSTLSIVKYKDHLTNRIKELSGTKNVDKGRLAQEVALFAKNSDVSEELVRLKSHLVGFKDALMSRNEVGKKLDFIAQELHREANTIASKCSDFKISKSVIQMKSDIEKIREQVKNIE